MVMRNKLVKSMLNPYFEKRKLLVDTLYKVYRTKDFISSKIKQGLTVDGIE